MEFRSDKMANSDKANQEVSACFEGFFVGKGDKLEMTFLGFTGSKLQTHCDAAQGAESHERDAHVQVLMTT